MRKSIVLGLTFGDEGKGVTTQWLCQQALKYSRKPVIFRFNGGPQAAHTINLKGQEHICSSYGSGVLLGIPTYYTRDMFFDPICAYNEYKTLERFNPRLYINECKIITPYDVTVGRYNSKVLSDGTCGKGIYQTFKRYADTCPSFSRVGDRNSIFAYLESVRNYYGLSALTEMDELFWEDWKSLPFDSYVPPKDLDEVIYEGAQGLLLDMDYGYYPNVTPSHTGLFNLEEETLRNADVYLVTRTYTTRHGNGYIPKYALSWNMTDKHETNVCNPFQGEFKTGILDVDTIYDAIARHHLDNLQKKYNLHYHLMVTHGDLPIKHNYIEYIRHGIKCVENICSIDELKEFFIRQLHNLPIKFTSIMINSSEYSNFE